MIAAGMGYPGGVMKLVLALTFTAMGVQAECDHPEFIQLAVCVSPYREKFSNASRGVCNKKQISTDICKDFEKIVECVNRNKISKECLVLGESTQLKHLGFFCTLSDFQERCPNAPTIKTGDSVQTTTPGGTSIRTRDSPYKGQTKGARGAAVTHTSFALFLVITILLLFIFMQIV